MDVWTLLQQRVRRSGGAPLVTYVDGTTAERTELSATSLANAAAKIANALRDEYALEPGDAVALDLPLHWQRSTWCAGAWTAGCAVLPGLADASLVVTVPDRAAEAIAQTSSPVAVVSLHPFGLPLTEHLPSGAHDVTVVVRQQPDAYLFEPADPDDPALLLGGEMLTSVQLVEAGRSRAEACGLQPGGRLLVASTEATVEDQWLGCLAVPLAADASAVLVHRGEDQLNAIGQQERITARCD